jgi:Fe-S-cluster-containing hydrogenase component 2
LKVCPLSAIEVYRGVYARVDQRRCVGCGMCAGECPAGVISVREVQA